jgi:deoxycytidine triphosphate deaminase
MPIMRHQDILGSMKAGTGLISYGDEKSIQACSYDLRVGTIIKSGKVIRDTDSTTDQSVEVLPGEIVTIITLEEVTLSGKIAGLAFEMNQWSSQGLLVLNPGHIDPGFSGPLSIKALNLRKTSITLRFHDPIFTILFMELTGDTDKPYPGEPKTKKDYERNFEERDREISPTSIGDLLRAMKELPFVTEDQLAARMWKHGSTIVSLLIGLFGVLLAIIALKK